MFVTGATGFIGSHFTVQALNRGHVVYALRRSNAVPRIPFNNQPIWVEGALDRFPEDCLRMADVFVHLAAHSANVPYDSLEKCIYWNVVATLAAATHAFDLGVRNFLFVGSCFEYGDAGDRYDRIPVTAEFLPRGTYPTSKAMASLAIREFVRQNSCTATIARVFHVFGTGEKPSRFWPALQRAAINGDDFPMSPGAQVRDFINVSDAAERLLAIAESLPGRSEPALAEVNVGSGQVQTLLQFAEHWWQVWQASGLLLPGALPYRAQELMRLVPLL